MISGRELRAGQEGQNAAQKGTNLEGRLFAPCGGLHGNVAFKNELDVREQPDRAFAQRTL